MEVASRASSAKGCVISRRGAGEPCPTPPSRAVYPVPYVSPAALAPRRPVQRLFAPDSTAMKLDHFLHHSPNDAWTTVERDIGGTTQVADGRVSAITVPHPRGAVRIEAHVTHVFIGKVLVPMVTTRFSVTLPSARSQRFSVARASFATAVAEWFGALDIHVDDPTFDAAFVLKGETPDQVRALFADATLRERYLRDFEGQLHRHDDASLFGDPTPDADPFTLDVPGLVDSAPKLRALYDLFVATLDRLD